MAPCAFLLGLVSAVAQVILIRELMTVFSGHELVFAVVLGVWLLGIAVGSAWVRPKGLPWAFAFLAVSIVLVPFMVVGLRLLKPVLGIPLGSVADMGIVSAAASAVLLPLTIVLGAVFAVLSRESDGKDVYAFEALGFVAGGVLITFVLLVPLPRMLDLWSQQVAWPGYRLVNSEQTRYGSIVVVDRAGQKSFFENGRHLFTSGDNVSAEEVHAGLLAHPAPRRVFLAGGGMSQAGREALKHPLERLDYAQLDPAVVRIEQQQAPAPEDARLNVMTGDPRVLLEASREPYDVIVMNEGDPVSLLTGRFFTREFFTQARRHLARGGILALTVSSSENYVNAQGKAYARSVHATLVSVFGHVQVIPGERMTFIASDVPYMVTADLLAQRLKERGITTQFMRDYYLNDRMSPSRMAEVQAWLRLPGEVSTDMLPRASLRALVFVTTRTGTGFAKFMGALEQAQWAVWLVIPMLFVFAFGPVQRFLPLAGAATAGFTQMVFQVVTILLVQSIFGYAYAVVGVLTAGFMLGAFGGVYFSRYFKPGAAAWIQVILAMSFIGIVMFWPVGAFIFPLWAGMAGGIQFTLYMEMAPREGSARVYAADVVGAGLGALCAGLFLVPLWGMAATMLFVAGLNGVMGLLLRVQPKRVSADL